MRRTRSRKLQKEEDIQLPQLPEEDSSLEQVDKDHIQSKRKKYKEKKETKKSTKSKPKMKRTESNEAEDSEHSEILDIRHADESTREHIRPAFLKRWDGISNELELTPSELNNLSPMLQVYWATKSKNMNVIVFLEFGKMEYFAFEDDAIKLNQIFKKKLKKFSKFLMVNFWCKQIEVAKKELFDRKIPVMVMNQIDDPRYKQLNGIMRRQVVEVLTPGLHLNMEDSTYKERLIVVIYKEGARFGIVVLDGESNHFYVEEMNDDEYLHEIRRVINRYRPVEVIVPDRDHKEIVQIAKQICNPYIVQMRFRSQNILGNLRKFKDVNNSTLFKKLLQSYQQENPTNESVFSRFHTTSVLSLIYHYLQTLSLSEKIFNQGLFQEQSYKKSVGKPFFDSQVYENLEIFRIKNEDQGFAQPGTLIAYLDKCKTIQGKKLLHKWIDQPLLNIQEIKQRQEALKQLVQQKSQMLILHDKLFAYQKFEKRIADVYHWVIRNSERGKLTLTTQINHEKQYDQRKNPAIVRLKQIINILKLFKQYEQYLKQLSKFDLKSKYLRRHIDLQQIDDIHILPLDEIAEIEGLPQIGYVADSIMRKFTYDEISDYLEPAPGLNEVFDHQKQEIEAINRLLSVELQKWKKYFNNEKISFVSARAKNEIQVPKTSIKNSRVHEDLIFSSQISNAVRYTSPRTYELSEELIAHEIIISQTFEPFLQEIVLEFCSFRYLWDLYVQSIAKLDVLFALATVAKNMPIRCLPQFTQERLHYRNGSHISLLQVRDDTIPHSLDLNNQQKILLLTGPNMGGKSTLLKQTCLLAIMAQIGCYVPAEHYESIIFDQIFCRIGASDRIFQGKSTFYVELEQTKRIISQATSSSLIIIDQLGRGTSTYDGMAIAEAILNQLLNNIGAYTLFSTHYSQLTDRFNSCKEVKLGKMAYIKKDQQIQFTYQLVPGIAQKSFAVNVAKMAGLPLAILQKADQVSRQMHRQIDEKKHIRRAMALAHRYDDPNPQWQPNQRQK